MIDNTPILSRAYDRLLEAERDTRPQPELERKAYEVLSTLDYGDVQFALLDKTEDIRRLVAGGHETLLGFTIRQAIWDYCEKAAKRELEA